jgi:hypothetical protein
MKPHPAFIVDKTLGKPLALLEIAMRDKMVLISALLLALLLFALQNFVKQNLLSPSNMETVGKFQRMFQVSGLVGPFEFIPTVRPIAHKKNSPRKSPTTACPKHRVTVPCASMRSTT